MSKGSSSTETFSSVLLHLPRSLSIAPFGQCEVPSNSDLNIDAKSSNLTAPCSSRWTDSSCRSNLIINFDTSKLSWLNIPGSISIHFRSLHGINTRDNAKVGVGRGLAFLTSFPVPLLFSTLATGISFDASVKYLLVTFTIRTQESVLSRNKDSITISTSWRPW